VFHRAKPGEVLPRETRRLGVVVSGARTPPHWTSSGKSGDYDLWDLKALFEEGVRLVGGGTVVDPGSTEAGGAMELSADRPPWAGRLFGFEVDLRPVARVSPIYRPLPTTPPAERDLALVLPDGVRAVQVETVLRRVGGLLLESVRTFDEYRSEQVGGRSVAWRLVFRAPDRTLRDEEVEAVVKKIVETLKEELHVRLRES